MPSLTEELIAVRLNDSGVNDRNNTRIDCHVKVLSKEVVERAIAAGLDALVYAPHFTSIDEIREAARRFTSDDLLIIPAREVFTGTWRDRKHVLGIGIREPIPDFIPLEDALTELDRQDAAVLIPHPTYMTISLDRADIRRYRDVIDAIETYNPKHFPHHNRRAKMIAGSIDASTFGSSYAHLVRTVGSVYTAFDRPIDSESSLVEALKTGEDRRIVHAKGLERLTHSTFEMAHLVWENSWQKFHRVVLDGIESTHPSNDRYADKFGNRSAD